MGLQISKYKFHVKHTKIWPLYDILTSLMLLMVQMFCLWNGTKTYFFLMISQCNFSIFFSVRIALLAALFICEYTKLIDRNWRKRAQLFHNCASYNLTFSTFQEFLQLLTSVTDGKMVDYKSGRQLSRKLHIMVCPHDSVSIVTIWEKRACVYIFVCLLVCKCLTYVMYMCAQRR